MGKLDGKVALVTGGGTGIGKAASVLFAREGADVAVNYSRSKDDAEQTASEIVQLGRKAFAVCADVSQDSSVRKMVDEVVGTLGRLDILVNNAGTTQFVPITDLEGMTEELWDRVMAVNLKGAFFCCRAAIPAMKANGGGDIVNVSSISGFTGQGSSIAYAASKAALINIGRALAVSQGPEIRVNTVAPGVVETRWIKGWEKFTDKHREVTPLGRNSTPEDVAHAIFALVTNGFITGHTLVVDGGRTLV